MNAHTTQPAAPPAGGVRPPVQLVLGADGLVITAGAVWLLWNRWLKPQLVQRLARSLVPIEEERQLSSLLAQVAVICRSGRVVLAAFHNGVVDATGYHLVKLSTIGCYTSQGVAPMREPIRDLPVGRIMTELEQLLDAGPGRWVTVEQDSEELPQACRDHLTRNQIEVMANRLVMVGNLPIGILSVQYTSAVQDHAQHLPGKQGPHAELLEKVVEQIEQIMRKRVVNPTFLRKLLKLVKASGAHG